MKLLPSFKKRAPLTLPALIDTSVATSTTGHTIIQVIVVKDTAEEYRAVLLETEGHPVAVVDADGKDAFVAGYGFEAKGRMGMVFTTPFPAAPLSIS